MFPEPGPSPVLCRRFCMPPMSTTHRCTPLPMFSNEYGLLPNLCSLPLLLMGTGEVLLRHRCKIRLRRVNVNVHLRKRNIQSVFSKFFVNALVHAEIDIKKVRGLNPGTYYNIYRAICKLGKSDKRG